MQNNHIVILSSRLSLANSLQIFINSFFKNSFICNHFTNVASLEVFLKGIDTDSKIEFFFCSEIIGDTTGLEIAKRFEKYLKGSSKILIYTSLELVDIVYSHKLDNIDYFIEEPLRVSEIVNLMRNLMYQNELEAKLNKETKKSQNIKESLSVLRTKFENRTRNIVQILEAFDSILWRLNLNNSQFDVFTSEETIYGYEADYFDSLDKFITIVEPEYHQTIIHNLKALKVKEKDVASLTINIRRKDQSLVKVKILGRVESYSDEGFPIDIVGILSIVEDIIS